MLTGAHLSARGYSRRDALIEYAGSTQSASRFGADSSRRTRGMQLSPRGSRRAAFESRSALVPGNSVLLPASNQMKENCSSPVFGPLSGEGRARGEPR